MNNTPRARGERHGAEKTHIILQAMVFICLLTREGGRYGQNSPSIECMSSCGRMLAVFGGHFQTGEAYFQTKRYFMPRCGECAADPAIDPTPITTCRHRGFRFRFPRCTR